MRALTALVSVVVALCLAAPAALAGEGAHYLELINRAYDRVASVSAAPAGSQAWQELLHGEEVRGGGGAVTVQVAAGPCLQDVRVDFANGRRALYPGVDVCRHRGLRIQPLPAAREARPAIAAGDGAKRDAGPVPVE